MGFLSPCSRSLVFVVSKEILLKLSSWDVFFATQSWPCLCVVYRDVKNTNGFKTDRQGAEIVNFAYKNDIEE